MTPGHCTACDGIIWRGVLHPATQVWGPLWPDPTSVYAVLESPEGLVVGLGYHAQCAPQVGDAGPSDALAHGRPLGPTTVVRLDPAPARYTYWFSPRFGQWLEAWLRDLARDYRTPESAWAPLLAQWDQDRLSGAVMEASVQ